MVHRLLCAQFQIVLLLPPSHGESSCGGAQFVASRAADSTLLVWEVAVIMTKADHLSLAMMIGGHDLFHH